MPLNLLLLHLLPTVSLDSPCYWKVFKQIEYTTQIASFLPPSTWSRPAVPCITLHLSVSHAFLIHLSRVVLVSHFLWHSPTRILYLNYHLPIHLNPADLHFRVYFCSKNASAPKLADNWQHHCTALTQDRFTKPSRLTIYCSKSWLFFTSFQWLSCQKT